MAETLDLRRAAMRCAECGQRFGGEATFCPFDGTKLDAVSWDPTGDPLLGRVIDGRYEVTGVLGEGGMGTVYRVRHTALDRLFAMKVLRRDLAGDADLAARFMREARATASVKHPGIVAINDFGLIDPGVAVRIDDAGPGAVPVPYFVMEHLVGQTLAQAIKTGGALPAALGVRIVLKVAAALAAAHAQRIVQRELKPDNVYLLGSAAGAAAIDAKGESAGVLPARPLIDTKGESAGVLPACPRIDTTGANAGVLPARPRIDTKGENSGVLPARPRIDTMGEIAGVIHARPRIDTKGEIAGVLPARPPVDVRVVDFGAALVIGTSRVTKQGVVFGTPHYMSPEQAGGQEVDHRADIYALGVIMYEMFTGRVPFVADTYMGVLTQHMFVKPVPPSRVSESARGLGALEDIILRTLEKRPEQRYATMQALAADIERVSAFEPDGTLSLASGAVTATVREPPVYAMANELEPATREEVRASRGASSGGSRLSSGGSLRRVRARAWVTYGGVALGVAAATVSAVRLLQRPSAPAPPASPALLAETRPPPEPVPAASAATGPAASAPAAAASAPLPAPRAASRPARPAPSGANPSAAKKRPPLAGEFADPWAK